MVFLSHRTNILRYEFPHSSSNKFIELRGSFGTRLTQVLASKLGTLYTTDDHCWHLESSPDYNEAYDRKGQ